MSNAHAQGRLPKIRIRPEVIDKNLCCGCGACVGVCPTGVLSIDLNKSHVPLIDESKCTGCDLCYDVCPGRGYPVAKWVGLQRDEATRMFVDRGPVRKYLMGHSLDPEIRLNSASGGIATSLMLHLLETGQVDDVVVIGMENDRPVARLTHDPQVVRESVGSKYGPVPMLETLIPELRKQPRRIAMTVTPCQLGGWRRAVERIPKLRKSSVLTIGLFCGQVQSYDSLISIAATLGIQYPGDAKFTDWRYGPYPGSARFEFPDGTAVEKPLYPWLDVAVPHFSLNRCFLCPDGGNWLADMTLGDIHSGGNDETVTVCRTRRAVDVLASAQDAGRIALQEMTTSQVEQCVIRHISRSKMLPAIARNAWLEKMGKPHPAFDYDGEALFPGRLKLMAIFWVWKYRLTFWCRGGWRRAFLLNHPRVMEKTGHFLYYFPATIPGWKLAIRLKHKITAFRKTITSFFKFKKA
ncbi:Coenzyme F420 hydrogenase/dehydrogenase, beta subunit C-terminal domain [Desulfoluna spongiiphila]|uniref:Coenzyme F420 hydrogenase/dehydrogenase, beta subunit C-terminal domain n=1 Tax=Desulfoluna spongiiphila TaxID=419481 RepID=UPI0012544593|nr:Coenzyme F420 hydrogenase/dehydrogenase, beta subunit C-terminal domain [Desulfoluna spongiiphila]VVS94867.1 4fe-4s dicluster domain [Desulfoluna spongiiphila]